MAALKKKYGSSISYSSKQQPQREHSHSKSNDKLSQSLTSEDAKSTDTNNQSVKLKELEMLTSQLLEDDL